jgi:tetratricopeptide (TPR) repeat protein
VDDVDREVLSDPTVAGYVNEHFVPLRADVTAAANAELLRRYRLGQEAPVFLVLGPGGAELDRYRGALPREEFLGLLRETLGGNDFAALERRAAAGERGYDFLLAYGRRLYHRGAPEAEEVLRRAVEQDPEAKRPATVEAQYLLALLARGDASVEALAAFVAAHPESPHAIEVHQTLALLYGTGSADKAIASFEFLRSRDALDTPWRKHDYAHLLAWNGREVELALALVTDALRAVPDEPRWLDTKAECLSRLGRYDEAIVVGGRAVEKAQRPEDRAEFGRALYEMKKRRAEAPK